MRSHANMIFAQDYTNGTVSGQYVDRATEEEMIALINIRKPDTCLRLDGLFKTQISICRSATVSNTSHKCA